MSTAFGYFGSKKRLAVELCDKLPPHNAWVELFCGSAALTFAKAPAPIEVINDLDKALELFARDFGVTRSYPLVTGDTGGTEKGNHPKSDITASSQLL